MKRRLGVVVAAGPLLIGLCLAPGAAAQQSGGMLRVGHFDSPASMSMHEESTNAVNRPISGVFNNLVMYKQDVKQNSPDSIVPDLATGWSWNEDGTELTLPLRQGVKWHDGKPFTAADVKCTWDLLQGKGKEKLRLNPRKSWYVNLKEVTTNGDYEVTFHLMRPQAGFLAMLATGWSPVYPCHVTPAQMRLHPIGTGPFKFIEFKPNEIIKVVKNPDYWKPGRPYLDGIEYRIVPNRSTAILGFVAGQFDVTWPYSVSVPLLKDVKNQAPQALCELQTTGGATNLLVNRDAPPFDNPDLRKALALALDRQAFVDIMTEGQATIGGAMLPAPEGQWGMPPELVRTIPGYDPDVQKNRAQAREIMKKLGYEPDKKLEVKVSTRNVPTFRDPAVILIDQLKEIYVEAVLDTIETANWHSKVTRKDYKVALNNTGSGVDDPDQQFFENYACGSDRNYSGYCNPELDKKFEEQSTLSDQEKRRKLVWEIDKKLQE